MLGHIINTRHTCTDITCKMFFKVAVSLQMKRDVSGFQDKILLYWQYTYYATKNKRAISFITRYF